MKVGRGIYTGALILLLMGGTIHCAGPQSQAAKEKAVQTPSPETRGSGKVDSQVGSAQAVKETPQATSQEPAREVVPGSRPMAQSEPTPPPKPPLREEPIAPKTEGRPEPPRPAPVPVMPMAPPGAAGPPPMAIPPGGVPPRMGPPAAGQPQPVDAARNSRFVLNFDNADIYEVIRVMAEMMGINYIVDPRVKGVVNIRTTGQISNKDILPVLQTILKMNGATAVQKGIV